MCFNNNNDKSWMIFSFSKLKLELPSREFCCLLYLIHKKNTVKSKFLIYFIFITIFILKLNHNLSITCWLYCTFIYTLDVHFCVINNLLLTSVRSRIERERVEMKSPPLHYYPKKCIKGRAHHHISDVCMCVCIVGKFISLNDFSSICDDYLLNWVCLGQQRKCFIWGLGGFFMPFCPFVYHRESLSWYIYVQHWRINWIFMIISWLFIILFIVKCERVRLRVVFCIIMRRAHQLLLVNCGKL